jgi:hypothetical protein
VADQKIEGYLSMAGEREPDLRELHALITVTAPSFAPVLMEGMNKPMVGYGMQPYTNAGGKTYDWPVIALANQKNYISLYICALEDGEYVAEKHASELGTVDVGKSCVRFKHLSDLNIPEFKSILHELENRVARGEKIYGI